MKKNLLTLPDGSQIDLALLSAEERKRQRDKLKREAAFNRFWKEVERFEKAQERMMAVMDEFTGEAYSAAVAAKRKQVTVSDYRALRSVVRQFRTPTMLDETALEAKPLIDAFLADNLEVKGGGEDRNFLIEMIEGLFGGREIRWSQQVQTFLNTGLRDKRLIEAQEIIKGAMRKVKKRDYFIVSEKDEAGKVINELRF